jgi:Coenzyme PQQ synthesis protein D (PqqD)
MPDGSGLLVEAESGDAFAVNVTGADVWELCDGRRPAATIAAVLLDRYEAEPAAVEAGVAALLAHFRDLGLLAEG